MAIPEFVADYLTESVFSLKMLQSLFFVRFRTFPINMKALKKMAVTKSVPESVFSKASGLYCK